MTSRDNKRRGNGQGSIFKRGGKGSWYAAWYDQEGKRKSVNTKTTDQATARALAEHVEDYLIHC